MTNAEFLEFVQQGGYNTDEGWDCPIEYQGQMLECDELRSMLVDETNMPGLQLELRQAAPGPRELPGVGVSWFEAMAFARSRDDLAHRQWASVASLGSASRFVPKATFRKTSNVGDSITLILRVV